MRTDFDVLIVGGGMVGACAAALAIQDDALAGLRVALLEATPPASTLDDEVDVRVSAVSRASERILRSTGAWQRIDPQHISPYEEMIVWDEVDKPGSAQALRFSAAESSEPNLGYIVENRRVLKALYDSRALRERVTVLRGELMALEASARFASVRMGDGRSISVRLVIGADGADSRSRALAGIDVATRDYSQSAFVTHVATQRPHARAARQRFLATGPIAFLPLNDGRSSIVWTTAPDHARQLLQVDERTLEMQVRDAIGGVMGEITVAGPRASFPLRMLHARTYCAERCVLIGDAAHAVHPLAGQGVNLGFLDAAALVQTLADAVGEAANLDVIADARVLRRYERWRKSENALALALIDQLNGLFSNSQPMLSKLRRYGMGLVNQTTPLKRLLMTRAMGTSGELPRLARQPSSAYDL